MTGLAATLGADSPTAAAAVADALLARGSDLASWRAGSAHLVARAAMPAVHEMPGGALLLDGDAAPSALAAAYARGGSPALVAGGPPYAVVLADLARDALLLARNGDGPPLYWARLGGAVLVASEPAALLAAGVPAAADDAVLERFVTTGACDDTPATFFAGVRRVLPGQVVEVTREAGGCRLRLHEPPAAPQLTATAALAAADLSGRIGIRLGCGAGAAAVLGEVLARGERPRPLPVYSTTFPELAAADSSASCAAALLGSHAMGAARHRALPFFADEIDVDAYLADLGEPTPELDDWLRWAIARRVAGEVDALVDAASGAYLSRLADRVTSRFGVPLRVPLQDVPEAGRQVELAGAVQRTRSPSAAGDAAEAERRTEALLAGLLRRMRAELVTTFLRPRGTAGGLADTLALVSGDRVDVRSLWRRYVVERWLRTLEHVDHGVSARHAGRHAEVLHDRRGRVRRVRTELLSAGDKIPEKIAWYVGEAVAQQPAAQAAEPWYVLVAAKPVAVMQGRARNLWDIEPGVTARVLHRLAGHRGGPSTPWAMQVAIEEGGRWRLALAAVWAAANRAGWCSRAAGTAVCAIREPREDAAPPGNVAVIPAPVEPDRVAADVVAALRNVLPYSSYRMLGGCALVSATGDVLGWAGGPGGGAPGEIAGDDPFGDDHTPIAIAS
jgi:hypothetical protein